MFLNIRYINEKCLPIIILVRSNYSVIISMWTLIISQTIVLHCVQTLITPIKLAVIIVCGMESNSSLYNSLELRCLMNPQYSQLLTLSVLKSLKLITLSTTLLLRQDHWHWTWLGSAVNHINAFITPLLTLPDLTPSLLLLNIAQRDRQTARLLSHNKQGTQDDSKRY